jgi:hypothetical protein
VTIDHAPAAPEPAYWVNCDTRGCPLREHASGPQGAGDAVRDHLTEHPDHRPSVYPIGPPRPKPRPDYRKRTRTRVETRR